MHFLVQDLRQMENNYRTKYAPVSDVHEKIYELRCQGRAQMEKTYVWGQDKYTPAHANSITNQASMSHWLCARLHT